MKKEYCNHKNCKEHLKKNLRVCTSASKDLSQHRPDCELRNPIRKIKCYATLFGGKNGIPMLTGKPTEKDIVNGREYGYRYYQAEIILGKEL